MVPSVVANNEPYRRLANPKDFGKSSHLTFLPTPTYLTDLVLSQFGGTNGLPPKNRPRFGERITSALTYHILPIILGCTQEQVVRTDTWRVITVVENVQSVWNSPIRKLITNAVSFVKLSWPRPYSDRPISVGISRSNPEPTRLCLQNLLPEAGLKSPRFTWSKPTCDGIPHIRTSCFLSIPNANCY